MVKTIRTRVSSYVNSFTLVVHLRLLVRAVSP
jgi:hypothetical protein